MRTRKTQCLLVFFVLNLALLNAQNERVGIGTTTPIKTLDVQGDINYSGNLYKNGLLLPTVNAVNDLEDGKATSLSIAIGTGAGLNGVGNYNVFSGSDAGRSNSTGYSNVFSGYQSGYFNSAGHSNVFLGDQSGHLSTHGNFNIFIGYQSGYSNSTGNENVFSGYRSGYSNLSGHSNVFSGHRSGYSNSSGYRNVFSGYESGYHNTSGRWNVFSGYRSGYYNSTGRENVFSGYTSGYYNSTGRQNVFSGYASGYKNTTGLSNVFSGHTAGYSNSTGNSNVLIGYRAGYASTTAFGNSCIGSQSGEKNTTGHSNSFFGYGTGGENTTGYRNVFTGYLSGLGNTSGYGNVCSGYFTGYDNTTGDRNAFFGYYAGGQNTTGYDNVAIGSYALNLTDVTNTTRCTFLGNSADASGNYTNGTALGYNAKITASNQIRIGNANITSIGGYEPWTNVSDQRFKKNIRENIKGLEFIKALRPVTYQLDQASIKRWHVEKYGQENHEEEIVENKNPNQTPIIHSGFLAQEVEATARRLGYDFSGVDAPKNDSDFYGLRYATFVVPLVKAVQEQQEMIEALKAENEKLKESNKAFSTLYSEVQKLKKDLEKISNL